MNRREGARLLDCLGQCPGPMKKPISQYGGDNGNQMRYDPLENQYVFQWDINGAAITNGTYQSGLILAKACAATRIVSPCP